MTDTTYNKYRAAAGVLLRGRNQLVDALADEILEQSDDLLGGGYAFQELLENQGTRIHFLSLLVAQLEQSADELDERRAAAAAARGKKRSRKDRGGRSPVPEQPSGKATRDRERPADEP